MEMIDSNNPENPHNKRKGALREKVMNDINANNLWVRHLAGEEVDVPLAVPKQRKRRTVKRSASQGKAVLRQGL